MNNVQVMKFQKPRDLNDVKDRDSLEHWINKFTVYAHRDPDMAPFLTRTWDINEPHMHQAALGENTPAQMAAKCKLFLRHVTSFLPNPYFKHIKQRTTSLSTVWDLFREVFNIEKDASSTLDLVDIDMNKSKPYLTFWHRLVYLMENNLAPANLTVNHVNSGALGDKLTISMMDHATCFWLGIIDRRLGDLVRSDYSVQIKTGARLSELVPKIAKALPGMFKRLSPAKSAVKCISCDDFIEEVDDYVTDTDMYTAIRRINRNTQRGAR